MKAQKKHVPAARIRRAMPSEAKLLTKLAKRSKASWGYDAAFMDRVAHMLEVSEDYIAGWPVFIAEFEGEIIGFYGFREVDDETYLNDMWVAPERIGGGVGEQLWLHAVAHAREAGIATFLIASDPNAEGFYAHMGATRIGEINGGAGRSIPLLRYDVS